MIAVVVAAPRKEHRTEVAKVAGAAVAGFDHRGRGVAAVVAGPLVGVVALVVVAVVSVLVAVTARTALVLPGIGLGLGAIEDCIARGRSINITLIFSLERHAEVAEAYLRGLERLVEDGGDPTRVASVASFFVSRVDTEADRRLAELGRDDLQGRLAVANARLAYRQYLTLFSGERWERHLPLAGMELATLSERLGAYFGSKQGVLVVRAGGNEAWQLQDGDVILSIDGREPNSAAHATRILRSYQRGEKLQLRVMRERKERTLQVTLPGGGKLGIYQPRHARPKSMNARSARKPKSRPRKAAKKTTGKKRGKR